MNLVTWEVNYHNWDQFTRTTRCAVTSNTWRWANDEVRSVAHHAYELWKMLEAAGDDYTNDLLNEHLDDHTQES